MKSGSVLMRPNVLWISAARVTLVISTLVMLILGGVTQEPPLLKKMTTHL